MNALDVVIAIVLGVAVLYGLLRGFVHVALGLAGFGLGLAAAFRLAHHGPDWFKGTIDTPATARLAAFALIFVGALVATALAIFLLGKLVRAAGIGWLDRLAGGVVGFVGGMLVIVGVLLGLTTFLPPGAGVLRDSKLLPMVLGGVDVASLVLPADLADAFRERRQALGGTAAPAPAAAPKDTPRT